MYGEGATVAEWSIIVDGLPAPSSNGTAKRNVPLGENLKVRDVDSLTKLRHVARAHDVSKRGRSRGV